MQADERIHASEHRSDDLTAYERLGLLLAINAVVMFLLTYALIDRLGHFFPNINRVGDDHFLRSMIPHHFSAILMCEHAGVTDPEIVELCGEIVEAQEREIAQMKDILARR